MKREIKFRAWDITAEPPEMTFFNLGQGFSGMDSCPIMQFTSLLDKHGKEIYEGDIVKYKSRDGKYLNDVVEIRFPRYWLRNEEFGWEGEELIEPEDTKIIGNIYENPDLIK